MMNRILVVQIQLILEVGQRHTGTITNDTVDELA